MPERVPYMVARLLFPGLFTGHDPTLGLGQKLFEISRVGSGRQVFNFKTDRVGPSLLDRTRPDLTLEV